MTVVLLCVLSGKGEKMKTEKKNFVDTKTMAELGMLIAITLLMGLTPLGTIPTPFLSISLVTVPVAIAAILDGPKGGTIVGGTFGLTSLINAITGKSGMMSALLMINPFGAVFTTLVPRLLEGLLVGLIFAGLHKIKPLKTPSYYIAAVCCPLLNTLFFMSSIIAFYWNSEYIQNLVIAKGATNPVNFVILLVGVQGIVEAVTCLVIAGAVSQAVAKVLKRD